MKATNSCVLALTLALGATIFLSSFIALQRHNNRPEGKGNENSEHYHGRGNSLRMSKDYSSGNVTVIPPVTPNTSQQFTPDRIDQTSDLRSNMILSQGTLKCVKSFEPTCAMYSYVRFWKKDFNTADCFQSPTRHPQGYQSIILFWFNLFCHKPCKTNHHIFSKHLN